MKKSNAFLTFVVLLILALAIVNAMPVSVRYPNQPVVVKPGLNPQLIAPHININLIKIAPASPGNSKPVSVSVNVTSPVTKQDICGLNSSNFKIDTLNVPPYGPAVVIENVLPISSVAINQPMDCDYWLSIVPTSYQGKQYTWVTGTYTLKLSYIQKGQQLAETTFSFRV